MARRADQIEPHEAMDLAFVSRSAWPRAGGIEAHLRRAAHGLSGKGHRVRIWASRIDEKPFTRTNTTLGAQHFNAFFDGSVETAPLPVDTFARLGMLPAGLGSVPGMDRVAGYHAVREATLPSIVSALAPRLRRAFEPAGLIHSFGGEQLAVAAHRAARRAGLPFVVTPFVHPGHWGDDRMNLQMYRDADAVIALLAGEARFYASKGIRSERIHVVGVAAPEKGEATDVRKAHKIDGPLVVCLGVKRPYKYRGLLEALKHTSVKATFAFVGPHTPESVKDFAACDDARVIEVGKVDEGEKWGWLDAADASCLPSNSEILPVSILEAWRMGTPVVVAEGSFTRDLVDHGTDGIVCKADPISIAAAVEEILSDTRGGREMGRRGAAKVAERYEARGVCAHHEEIYASLM
jgi:phosphatidyl-myo-inositol dimannoside synthase